MKAYPTILIVLLAVILIVSASPGDSTVSKKNHCSGCHEVWRDCTPPQGGCTERICGYYVRETIDCAKVCRPKCYCDIGFKRLFLDGPCIPEDSCPPDGTFD